MKNFLILSFFVCTSIFSVCSFAQPLPGASYIGMCSSKFPCAQALDVHSGAWGYLADAFGHKCSCVLQGLKQEKTKYVRVHIANGTCFPERGRRCVKYDVFKDETIHSAERKVLRRDARILGRYRASLRRTRRLLSHASPSTQLRYSLCLECPLSNKARSILLQEALRFFPKDAIVDSPLYTGCLPGLICEKHGDSPRYRVTQRCISDTDGITLFDANIDKLKARSKNCEAIFYWTTGFNLLPYKYQGRFIPPYARTHKADPIEFDGLKQCLNY